MIDYLDILNFLFRSIHVVAGIAWIGASFYFVMLDLSLRTPRNKTDSENGVCGEIWAVHGGGIYSSKKYLAGPRHEVLPDELHWSKWEAYTTWLSGMSLLALIYWARAEVYLIDSAIMQLTRLDATLLSVVFILGFWLIYHTVCIVMKRFGDMLLMMTLIFILTLLAWSLGSVFSARGAFMMFGACLGTTMVANVFFVIIPGQKKMLAAISAGEEPPAQLGINGKQRSVHNTYFTLPVLFCMIVNHYAAFYSQEHAWLILLSISLAGVFIRLFFVSRHRTGSPSYLMALLGVSTLVITLIVVYLPTSTSTSHRSDEGQLVSMAEVKKIIDDRCTVCHSSAPTFAGFNSPPKGVIYETEGDVINQAKAIYQQAVVLRAMPINNLTGLTESERVLLGRWFNKLSED